MDDMDSYVRTNVKKKKKEKFLQMQLQGAAYGRALI